MDLLTSRSARKRRLERGSAFAEALFVMPVLVLLLFGLADFSMLFRDYLAASNAARAAVRATSLMEQLPCDANDRREAGEAVVDDRFPEKDGLSRTVTIQHAELASGALCTKGLLGVTIAVSRELPFLNGFFAGTAFPPVTFRVSAFAMNENGN